MTEDVKRAIRACLNEADECERRGSPMNARDLRDHLRTALSALEAAATVAPAKTVQDVLELLDAFHGDNRMSYDAYTNLHDAVALLDVRPAPAVDREALAQAIVDQAWADSDPHEIADAVIAHLGARDVRDVQAEALERAAKLADAYKSHPRAYIGSILREHAQAIREARSER